MQGRDDLTRLSSSDAIHLCEEMRELVPGLFSRPLELRSRELHVSRKKHNITWALLVPECLTCHPGQVTGLVLGQAGPLSNEGDNSPTLGTLDSDDSLHYLPPLPSGRDKAVPCPILSAPAQPIRKKQSVSLSVVLTPCSSPVSRGHLVWLCSSKCVCCSESLCQSSFSGTKAWSKASLFQGSDKKKGRY